MGAAALALPWVSDKSRRGDASETSEKEPQISPLRSPGFPVESRVVGQVRAALFAEGRIRGRCQV